jgi:hypothetical protein
MRIRSRRREAYRRDYISGRLRALFEEFFCSFFLFPEISGRSASIYRSLLIQTLNQTDLFCIFYSIVDIYHQSGSYFSPDLHWYFLSAPPVALHVRSKEQRNLHGCLDVHSPQDSRGETIHCLGRWRQRASLANKGFIRPFEKQAGQVSS